jgi:4-hydroxybenzoyl-CoA thioesterase
MPPFRHLMPVRFADVDHAGIVYYPRFFHYFHTAFEELFRARMGSRGYVALLDEQRIGFPAVSTQCDYKAPLRFGDIMAIEVSLERMSERSVTLRYRVYRCPEPGPDGEAGDPASDGVLAAEGTTTSAVVDLDAFRATPIPAHLRQLFAALT